MTTSAVVTFVLPSAAEVGFEILVGGRGIEGVARVLGMSVSGREAR
jgi:hypothetical protein